ncbi:hypothetical protein [Oceanobacillus massiliensis]|nr:hypothetical protein [Oceanobacillus massiliensis]
MNDNIAEEDIIGKTVFYLGDNQLAETPIYNNRLRDKETSLLFEVKSILKNTIGLR